MNNCLINLPWNVVRCDGSDRLQVSDDHEREHGQDEGRNQDLVRHLRVEGHQQVPGLKVARLFESDRILPGQQRSFRSLRRTIHRRDAHVPDAIIHPGFRIC
jgi:hypothetical protein